MGCCPSKKQLEYIDEHPQLDVEKLVVSHSKHEVLECNQQEHIKNEPVTADDVLGEIEATKVEEEQAEDEDEIEKNQQHEDVNKEHQVCTNPPLSEINNQDIPSASSIEVIRTLRKNSIKSVSREEMPIDSMFHRLQLIKEEEEKYKKEEEIRRTREMMEREVREYKMNILAS